MAPTPTPAIPTLLTGEDPYIVPTLMVGSPLEAIQGSIRALSTVIQGGDGGLLSGGTGSAGE